MAHTSSDGKMKRRMIAMTLLLGAIRANALDVFACEPEWASLAQELGRDNVTVYAATTARQDPHRVEARPSLVAKLRGADLVICTGAEFEAGWLPVLMRTAGNRRVQPGTRGFVAAADLVGRLEATPSRVDRGEGDIHPGGNPHVHLDPRNVAKVATVLSARFAELEPNDAARYRAWSADFQSRWAAALARWDHEAVPLRGLRVVPHHKDHVYLLHWLGAFEVMNIEPKPGLPPTAAHLASLVDRFAEHPIDVITRSAYQDPKPAEWLSERTHVPVLVLPYTVGGTPAATDLFSLFDDSLARLKTVQPR
jgi:zinc/manganese transport system substrate-binding protein